jgi:hypothetical protein
MYKLYTSKLGSQFVIRLSDNICIPFEHSNTDYQAFLAWKAEGNEPLPADEPEQP